MLNVNGGEWFITDHYQPQEDKFHSWLETASAGKKKLVVMDIGAGFNTPTVIRFRYATIYNNI